MKQLLFILLLAVAGWYGYGKYQAREEARDEAAAQAQRAKARAAPTTTTRAGGKDPLFFTCDGRTHCNQMTSCEEARYFLKNCPGLATEENREGASCEKQWCRK